MNEDKKQSNDCYSAGERRAMVWWQEWREQKLESLLACLDKMKVTPDILTLISLISGLVSALFLPFFPIVSFVFLALHVILDGLDGPLARFQKSDSAKGSFTDTMADQTVVTAILLACLYMGLSGAIVSTSFVFFYTVVVAFAMVRNRLNIPYKWLVRPRFFVYLCLPLALYVWPEALTLLLWGLNVVLIGSTVSGFRAIREVL